MFHLSIFTILEIKTEKFEIQKWYSTLATREIPIKTTVRYHLTPTRVIMMTKTDNKMEKPEPPTLLVELKNADSQ